MSQNPDDVASKAMAEAFRNADYNQSQRNIEHAIHDHNLPAYVRAFLVINTLSATESLTLEEAGIVVKVYAKYKNQPCRVTLASNMGDVAISFTEKDHGYNMRGLSIYDLTDYSPTPLWHQTGKLTS